MTADARGYHHDLGNQQMRPMQSAWSKSEDLMIKPVFFQQGLEFNQHIRAEKYMFGIFREIWPEHKIGLLSEKNGI
jgi:hypothetical protein